MSNYNPYSDFRSYCGTIDLKSEEIPEKSGFETCPNELCFFQATSTISYPAVINSVTSNRITPLDKHVIGIIATFTFVTAKQLNDYLTLLQIPYSDAILNSSVERLSRHHMIRINRFGADADHCSGFHVYSLNKNGADVAKVMGIPSSYSPMLPATPPADIKRILMQNQSWLSFVKSGLKLDFLRRSELINTKDDKSAVVRPSIAVGVDNDLIFIEIVRKGDFWERYLCDKLLRYKKLLFYWSGNSWGIEPKPLLIMNGENEEHNRRIYEFASDLGMTDMYFTEDTLFFGSQFYHSVYQFGDNSQREFFCFEPLSSGAA